MKATTKIQAERIAKAGVVKMAGYTYRPMPGKPDAGKVIKPSGEAYRVNTLSDLCNCPFYQENFQFGVCKHILFAKEEVAWNERADAEAAEWMPVDRIA